MKLCTAMTGVLFVLGVSGAQAVTASGVITRDTKWAGRVAVVGEVTVGTGVTLTVSAGTRVEFQGHYKLKVLGRLLAMGTPGRGITFTAANTNEGWHGIRFHDVVPPAAPNANSQFAYCTFEYGRASDGNDTNNVADDYGGALYIKNAPTILMDHCVIRHNRASYAAGRGWFGGGIYCYGTDLILINSTISDNTARYGGGLYFTHCAPMVSNCLIQSNWSFDSGGMRLYGCEAGTVIDCTISENYVSNNGEGAGIHLHQSSPVIVSCLISNNSGRWGAGIYANGSSPTITRCMIVNNTSRTDSGGGIHVLGGQSSGRIADCVIRDNTAGRWGGGVYCSSGSKPRFANCIIVGNTAAYGGGARVGFAAPTFEHCTLYGNVGARGGGGIDSENCTTDMFPTLVNSIVWTNTAPEGAQLAVRGKMNPGVLHVAFSDVQGGESNVYQASGSVLTWGEGNLAADPKFADAATGNFRILGDSPCLDAGRPNAINTDFARMPRPLDSDNNGTPGWCMGAYEFVHRPVIGRPRK